MWSKETLWAVQQGDRAFGHSPDQTGSLDRLLLASPLLTATGWIDSLSRLVSTDDAGNDVADVLHDMFAPLGFCLQRIAVPSPGGIPQPVVTAARRTGRKVCALYLPSEPSPQGGMHTARGFSRSGSRLYGRGAMGAKGAMAAVWAALRAADAVGLDFGYDPMLVLSEEARGSTHAGLRHLVSEGLVDDHVICLNGPRTPRVWMPGSGMLHLAVTLHVEITAPGDVPATLGRLRDALQAGDAWARADTGQLRISRAYRSPSDVPGIITRLRQVVRATLAGTTGLQADIQVVGQSPEPGLADQGPNGRRWRTSLSWGFGFPPGRFRPWSGAMASSLGAVQQAGVAEILVGGLRRQGNGNDAAEEFTTVEDVEALARSLLAFLSDIRDLPTY